MCLILCFFGSNHKNASTLHSSCKAQFLPLIFYLLIRFLLNTFVLPACRQRRRWKRWGQWGWLPKAGLGRTWWMSRGGSWCPRLCWEASPASWHGTDGRSWLKSCCLQAEYSEKQPKLVKWHHGTRIKVTVCRFYFLETTVKMLVMLCDRGFISTGEILTLISLYTMSVKLPKTMTKSNTFQGSRK